MGGVPDHSDEDSDDGIAWWYMQRYRSFMWRSTFWFDDHITGSYLVFELIDVQG
jgi:hypothetical protein